MTFDSDRPDTLFSSALILSANSTFVLMGVVSAGGIGAFVDYFCFFSNDLF